MTTAPDGATRPREWRVCDDLGCITVHARSETEALNIGGRAMLAHGPLTARPVS